MMQGSEETDENTIKCCGHEYVTSKKWIHRRIWFVQLLFWPGNSSTMWV